LGGSVYNIEKNAEALVIASKEIGLEVKVAKTKYKFKSRDQCAGQNHNIRTYNISVERVEYFKYLGTTLTHQNLIQGEIQNRLKSGNAGYHSVQHFCLPVCYPKM
jgi:hypothetical protein